MRGASPVVVLAASALACGGPSRASTAASGGDASAAAHDASSAVAQDGGEDGGVADAPGSDDGPVSRCSVTPTSATCDHDVGSVADATGTREVAYAVPLGAPPAGGWPAVVYFQGSFVPGHSAFAATSSDPFGMYWLTRTIAALLDAGYAVLAPDAASGGTAFWQTNVPPYAESWSGCSDDVFVKNLLSAVAQASFGPLDGAHLYAMGISSGGFMTSRMAVSYAGTFRALADHSGSYATCSATCIVPTPLPADHPPTLFLHGDQDSIVPMSSVQPYLDALQAEGHETKLVTDADAGHQWLAQGVEAIPAWFAAHP